MVVGIMSGAHARGRDHLVKQEVRDWGEASLALFITTHSYGNQLTSETSINQFLRQCPQ
jgi:hypothetical protein